MNTTTLQDRYNVLFQPKIKGASEKFKNQPPPLLRPRSVNFRQHFRNISRKTVPLSTHFLHGLANCYADEAKTMRTKYLFILYRCNSFNRLLVLLNKSNPLARSDQPELVIPLDTPCHGISSVDSGYSNAFCSMRFRSIEDYLEIIEINKFKNSQIRYTAKDNRYIYQL